jgi:hypothetical protein
MTCAERYYGFVIDATDGEHHRMFHCMIMITTGAAIDVVKHSILQPRASEFSRPL